MTTTQLLNNVKKQNIKTLRASKSILLCLATKIAYKPHMIKKHSAHQPTKVYSIKAKNLIKPLFKLTNMWSSGMVAKLMFDHDFLTSKKFLNVRNARKEWGLWLYSNSVLWVGAFAAVQRFLPWCLRIRRFFKYTYNSGTFNVIHFNPTSIVSPKKRIKRWLKKKYTTQSWR